MTSLDPDPDIAYVRNTRSMRMDPEPAEEFHMMDPRSDAGMSLLPVWSGQKFLELVNYPIIVEMWEKKKFGRVQRRWLAEFTDAERNKISRYYGRFYKWHLVAGVPHHVSCQLDTLQLLQRAVAFFAGV